MQRDRAISRDSPGPFLVLRAPMRFRTLIACTAALLASTSASYAGPCSEEIARFRAEIEVKQQANATAGPAAPEGTAATMHRQPTPKSIGAAESRLGEVPQEKLQAVWGAVDRATEADRAGDQIACEAALADARRAFSQ
jgi:hypothetical protein